MGVTYVIKAKKEKHKIESLRRLMVKPTPLENKKEDSKVSDKKIMEIMSRLKSLEDQKLYLRQDFNMVYAAKQIKTNTTYLSKVINETKKQSFSDYTNHLRINYVLKRLNTDKQFRNYTIKAIAGENGYRTPESFSHHFKSKTGISPAKFIRALKKAV